MYQKSESSPLDFVCAEVGEKNAQSVSSVTKSRETHHFYIHIDSDASDITTAACRSGTWEGKMQDKSELLRRRNKVSGK